jgi:hypothetical protein
MEEMMKKIGRGMSICMGLTMSFCLSLVGTLTSGHFTVPGFIISFIVSTIISLIIGFLIPMGKVTNALSGKLGLKQGTLPEKLFSSLISNLIYTPIMTFCMVFLAYQMAMKQSGGMAQLNFLGMFLPSLIICFIVGYVLILIFQPLFFKMLMAKYAGNEGKRD